MKMSAKHEAMIKKLGRRYADLGFPDEFIVGQARRELRAMILRALKAGATHLEVATCLDLSPQRISQMKNRALRKRDRSTSMEAYLAMNMKRPPTDVVVPISRWDGPAGQFEFELRFRGRSIKEFMLIPGGAEPIRAALRARGLDPDNYWTSPFMIREEART